MTDEIKLSLIEKYLLTDTFLFILYVIVILSFFLLKHSFTVKINGISKRVDLLEEIKYRAYQTSLPDIYKYLSECTRDLNILTKRTNSRSLIAQELKEFIDGFYEKYNLFESKFKDIEIFLSKSTVHTRLETTNVVLELKNEIEKSLLLFEEPIDQDFRAVIECSENCELLAEKLLNLIKIEATPK